MATRVVTNFSIPGQDLGISVKMAVSLDNDLEGVENVLLDVAKNIQKTVDGAVRKYEPSVRYGGIHDGGAELGVNLRVKDYVSKYLVTHEFIKQVSKRFKKEGIEFYIPLSKVEAKNITVNE